MVLNPALYAALRARFGTVKVSSPGVPAKWSYATDAKTHRTIIEFASGGEQYSVCCPFCGDRRHRLEIGHTWLQIFPRMRERVTHNLKCFNEQCRQVYKIDFYKPILDFIEGDGKLAAIAAVAIDEAPKAKIEVRMPVGCVPLDSLPPTHRAIEFLKRKYTGLDAGYLSRFYGACFTAEKDDKYRLAFERIIFPVYSEGKLVGWQGRAIDSKVEKRWLLPPGFQKVFYNGDRIGPMGVPIICEGITSSICCGPSAICIFGKELDDYRCKLFAQKWSTAVIALDPETYLPDPHASSRIFATELKEKLDKYLKVPSYLLRWPAEAMEKARLKMDYEARKVAAKKDKQTAPVEEHSVPDAADYGIAAMAQILAQIPESHRGTL